MLVVLFLLLLCISILYHIFLTGGITLIVLNLHPPYFSELIPVGRRPPSTFLLLSALPLPLPVTLCRRVLLLSISDTLQSTLHPHGQCTQHANRPQRSIEHRKKTHTAHTENRHSKHKIFYTHICFLNKCRDTVKRVKFLCIVVGR